MHGRMRIWNVSIFADIPGLVHFPDVVDSLMKQPETNSFCCSSCKFIIFNYHFVHPTPNLIPMCSFVGFGGMDKSLPLVPSCI